MIEDSSNDLIGHIKSTVAKVIIENEDNFNILIEKYLLTLKRKYTQLIYHDDYGDCIYDLWKNECYFFAENKLEDYRNSIKNIIDYRLNDFLVNERLTFDMFQSVNEIIDIEIILILSNKIDLYIRSIVDISETLETSIDLSDPILFEKSIMSFFQRYGWEAYQTAGSGDQGADVVAKKDNWVTIVQCKLYSQPLGNKAVQEAYSAKEYYKGNDAIVVTNSSYTKSARMLATSCSVGLFHHEELEEYINNFN